MNVRHTKLKKFAVHSRERLLAVTDENTAYTSFMRLCAIAFVCPQFISQLAEMPISEKHSAFEEKCKEMAGQYGGVFNNDFGNVEYPDILFSEILADILEISLYGDDILGWMHQYYNEPYRESLAVGLKKSKRLNSDDIAPATQVFTPDWIVKYLVQNTLVRRWYEGGGAKLSGFDEYIFGDISQLSAIVAEDMKFLDPCAGSGNMLLYAFDVFVEIYRSQGFSDNIAAEMALKKNLFGLELDERACAVAETALRIKAAKLGSNTRPQVFNFSGGNVENFAGSLSVPENCTGGANAILSMKFDVVATNPPYLGHSSMDSKLLSFVQEKFRNYSADLFLAFIVRSCELVKSDGRLGFLTPYTWLFIKTSEPFRRLILGEKCLDTLVQLEYSAFDNAVVPLCMFTFFNSPADRMCRFLRLADFKGDMDFQRQMMYRGISDTNCSYRFSAKAADFLNIPSAPLIYWLSDDIRRIFGLSPLSDVADVREGLITGDNDRFLRRWFEVSLEKCAFCRETGKKWYPLNKGGDYRRWFGNREFLINWEHSGEEIRNFRDKNGKLLSRPQSVEYNFHRAVSWSALTSGRFSARYYDENFMFNVAGSCAFSTNYAHTMWLLALLNSKVTNVLSQALNPTMNMNAGDTARLPIPKYRPNRHIQQLAEECVKLSEQDWDSFETSWDFQKHPLI